MSWECLEPTKKPDQDDNIKGLGGEDGRPQADRRRWTRYRRRRGGKEIS